MAQGQSQTFIGLTGTVGAYTVIAEGDKTKMRRRSQNKRVSSDAQVTQQGVMRDLGNLYKTLSMASMGQWNALGAQMLNKKGTKSLTGRQAFMSVNRSLVGAGLQPVTVAPQKPTYPAALPIKMQADARLTGSGGSVFSLSLTTDTSYGDMLQVFATPFAPVKGARARCSKRRLSNKSRCFPT